MQLDRNEDEVLAALLILSPRIPGSEKVIAQAKACFKDHKLLAASPTCRQAVACDEDMLRLRLSAYTRVVDVAVLHRPRRAVIGPFNLRRCDRPRFHSAFTSNRVLLPTIEAVARARC